MPLTQNHTNHSEKKRKSLTLPFMQWVNARCPQCGLPVTDWIPVAVPGPQERTVEQTKRNE